MIFAILAIVIAMASILYTGIVAHSLTPRYGKYSLAENEIKPKTDGKFAKNDLKSEELLEQAKDILKKQIKGINPDYPYLCLYIEVDELRVGCSYLRNPIHSTNLSDALETLCKHGYVKEVYEMKTFSGVNRYYRFTEIGHAFVKEINKYD